MNPPSLCISYEQQLEENLNNGNSSGGQNEQILEIGVNAKAPSYDVKRGVSKHSDCGKSKQEVTKHRLLFTVEFELLNSVEKGKVVNIIIDTEKNQYLTLGSPERWPKSRPKGCSSEMNLPEKQPVGTPEKDFLGHFLVDFISKHTGGW